VPSMDLTGGFVLGSKNSRSTRVASSSSASEVGRWMEGFVLGGNISLPTRVASSSSASEVEGSIAMAEVVMGAALRTWFAATDGSDLSTVLGA
jgi:hypothetical protein